MRVTSQSHPQALVVAPEPELGQVYQVLSQEYQLIHVRSIPLALKHLERRSFEIALLSASFSSSKLLAVLEALKVASHTRLIPVVIMVDLSQRINVVLGTQWGEKIGVLCSLSEKAEIQAVLERVCRP